MTEVLDLDRNGALAGEKVKAATLFRPGETVYFNVRLRTDYLRSGNKRRRIGTGASNVREEPAEAAVNEKNPILHGEESAPPSISFSLKSPGILSEYLKSYCRINDCPF